MIYSGLKHRNICKMQTKDTYSMTPVLYCQAGKLPFFTVHCFSLHTDKIFDYF